MNHELPIYLSTLAFVKDVAMRVRNLPVDVRRVWGDDIHRTALTMLKCIVRANKTRIPGKRIQYMEQFDEECDIMQMLLRITNTFNDGMPDKHKAILDMQIDDIRAQMGRWRNSTIKDKYTASECRVGGSAAPGELSYFEKGSQLP